MASTFTWTPSYGANKTIKPVVQTVKFGDGFEQRTSFSMNTTPQSWSLSFNSRDADEATEIEDFLIARAGVEAFYWTPIDADAPLVFVCSEWSRSLNAGTLYTVQCVFRQIYESI